MAPSGAVPLPRNTRAPGLASSMRAKSSPPVIGAMSVNPFSAPSAAAAARDDVDLVRSVHERRCDPDHPCCRAAPIGRGDRGCELVDASGHQVLGLLAEAAQG